MSLLLYILDFTFQVMFMFLIVVVPTMAVVAVIYTILYKIKKIKEIDDDLLSYIVIAIAIGISIFITINDRKNDSIEYDKIYTVDDKYKEQELKSYGGLLGSSNANLKVNYYICLKEKDKCFSTTRRKYIKINIGDKLSMGKIQ